MTGMLGVGIIEIQDLDNSRITIMFNDKIIVIKIAIPLVHGDTGDVEQGVGSTRLEIHIIDRLRYDPGLEAVQRFGIRTLGHPVMVAGNKRLHILSFRHQIAARTLHPGHTLNTSSPADRDHIR